MALSFALSFAVLLSAVLPAQSSYCASTCAVHVTQPILFFVSNAPNHTPGLSRKPMVDPHRSKRVYVYLSAILVSNACEVATNPGPPEFPCNICKKSCPLVYYWSVLRPMVPQGVHGGDHMHLRKSCIKQRLMAMLPLRHAKLLFIII